MNKLQDLSNVLTALLQYSSDIVICLTTDFTITALNTRAEKFYSWQQQTICGKNFLKICKSSNYTCPINANFFDNPTLLNINLDTKNSSGKQCNINWVICPLKPSDGTINGAIIIGKDIELKKNNIAYYLNGIINSIPGCLYWKDCNGHYLGCNDLTAKLAGLQSVYEVVGKTDEELWGKHASDLIENDKEVIATGKTVLVQEELRTATGEWLYFTGVKMPLRDENDNIIGVIGNSLDITNLKKTQVELKKAKEEAEILSKAKSEFITNMSHDVKTPLSGIIGLSEILTHTLKGEGFELAQSMLLAGQQLMSFFDNCLEVAGSEDADIMLLKEHFNLKILFNQIDKLFQPAALNKGLKFFIHYDNKIPYPLFGSRVGIYRIILNLIGNAIKFTQKGHISVHVKLDKKSSKKQAIIRITIKDTGIGIPKDKQKIIFERFTRLTPSYKGIYEGSGIGLYLVDKFVKAIQGEIHVHSGEGKGSEFVVVLPLEVPLDATLYKISAKKPANQARYNVNKKKSSNKVSTKLARVLLVEDNQLAQKVTQLILAPLCNQVDIADCGKKALELFASNKYDLVFLDIGLPDSSGYEIAKLFRKMEKKALQHVPIIALTAHVNDLIDKNGRSEVDEVINKPLSKEQAIQIIKQFVHNKNIINTELQQSKSSIHKKKPK